MNNLRSFFPAKVPNTKNTEKNQNHRQLTQNMIKIYLCAMQIGLQVTFTKQ